MRFFTLAVISVLVAGVHSFHTDEPWIYPCDNKEINYVHAGVVYYALIAAYPVPAPQHTFIISLCNLTVKVPENSTLSPGSSSPFFVGIWNASLASLDTFNEYVSVSGNGTDVNPLVTVFRSNVTNKTFSLTVTCNASAGAFMVTEVTSISPMKSIVAAQISDLCPVPPPSNGSSFSGSGPQQPSQPSSRMNAAIPVLVVVVVLFLVVGAVVYRRRQRQAAEGYALAAQVEEVADFTVDQHRTN